MKKRSIGRAMQRAGSATQSPVSPQIGGCFSAGLPQRERPYRHGDGGLWLYFGNIFLEQFSAKLFLVIFFR